MFLWDDSELAARLPRTHSGRMAQNLQEQKRLLALAKYLKSLEQFSHSRGLEGCTPIQDYISEEVSRA